MDLNVGDSADFLIADASGEKTGFDPITGSVLQQIPTSSYVKGSIDDDETGAAGPDFHSIQIFRPGSGVYTVTVVGHKLGEYNLAITPFAQDGSAEPQLLIPGIAGLNSNSTFTVQYSPTLGSVSTVVTVASFQSTIADITNSLQLGLINNQGIANALSSKINAASSASASGNNATSRNILNAFINQVNAQTSKHVNGTAVQVLLNDANSLLNQLH